MTDTTGKNNAIVQAQPQQLAVRHAWLVERGIHSLPILEITESRIIEFCSIINDYNRWGDGGLDLYRTLKTITDIGGDIRSNRRYLDLLIFVLLDKYYKFFFIFQENWHLQGEKANPQIAQFFKLITAALKALVGPLTSPIEAIWDVLFYGRLHFPLPIEDIDDIQGIGSEVCKLGKIVPFELYMNARRECTPPDTRILAIDWLLNWFLDYGNNRQRLITTTRDLFSDYLRTMLISAVQNTPLLFKLKYADALINDHVVEAIYFFIDMIRPENILSDELKKEAGYYILNLCFDAGEYSDRYFCNKISLKTVVYALDKLTELGDRHAVDMFFLIAENYKDLYRYSDVELKIISRAYNSLSAQIKQVADTTGDDTDVHEYNKLVMEELKRRGLHG